MDEGQFWEIIAQFDWSAGSNRDVMAPAIKALAAGTEDDLRAFEDLMAEKLYALDTQAHAQPTGFGSDHFSVDAFLYIRCYVVARGRDYYEAMLNNPQQMPTLDEADFEELLYLAADAAEAMGLEDYDHLTRLDYETFSNEDGWMDADFPDGLPEGHRPKHQR